MLPCWTEKENSVYVNFQISLALQKPFVEHPAGCLVFYVLSVLEYVNSVVKFCHSFLSSASCVYMHHNYYAALFVI